MSGDRSIGRALREHKRAMAARVLDYVDFNELPREVVAVAIDREPTRARDGKVVYEAGRPIVYSAPVHWNEQLGRWESFELAPRAPAYVPASAIRGPLPAPVDSLRVRPC